MKTWNWTYPRNMLKKMQEKIVREGLKPLLEQIRISMQALPQHCVQQQHRVNYLSQPEMLQELAGPAVRKAESLSWWQKNRSSQGDEDKNCSQLFPGQTMSGTHSVQEGPIWQRSWEGPRCCSQFSTGRPEQAPGMGEHTQGTPDGSTPNEGGDPKGTSPLVMVPKISRLEVPYLAEVMPVRVLNFSFPVAVFSCCCYRGFIFLCVQDSKSEFLSSSYYKGLQREHQEGKQESCLSVTAIFSYRQCHRTSVPKALPCQS